MIIENDFEVPGTPSQTMQLLLDAERVVPCMPGAELVEVVDDKNWVTKMRVKLGPVGMDFDNKIQLIEVNEEAGTVKMGVSGRDSRGKGGAEGTVDASFIAIDGGTKVAMVTDLRFSGQAAQLGRPNLVKDVSTKMIGDFAECLRQQMQFSNNAAAAAEQAANGGGDASAAVQAAPPPVRAAKPISGFSVMLAAITGAIKRLFGRSSQ